jgi:hypothetical protein
MPVILATFLDGDGGMKRGQGVFREQDGDKERESLRPSTDGNCAYSFSSVPREL